MFSLETIKQMNEERAEEARERRLEPYLYNGNPEYLKRIPNIGNHRPKGWKLVETYFVDSSGFGTEGELALTFNQFANRAKIGYGYAIIEAGQFQVYIGEFVKIENNEKINNKSSTIVRQHTRRTENGKTDVVRHKRKLYRWDDGKLRAKMPSTPEPANNYI